MPIRNYPIDMALGKNLKLNKDKLIGKTSDENTEAAANQSATDNTGSATVQPATETPVAGTPDRSRKTASDKPLTQVTGKGPNVMEEQARRSNMKDQARKSGS